MLDLDLDLEADLGVDTVKQAEVMLRSARLTASRGTTTQTARFPTLAHVIRLRATTGAPILPSRPPIPAANELKGECQSRKRSTSPAPASEARPRRAVPSIRLRSASLALVVEKTGYPRTCWTWTWISKPISEWIP